MRLHWILWPTLFSCSSDEKARSDDSDLSGPTFYQDVLPVVGENCQACHNSDQPMGQAFPLETYEHVSPLAETLLAKMQPEGDPDDAPYFMPPTYARDTPECSPWLTWKGAYQASPSQLSLFSAWIDSGKLEGDPDEPATFTRPTVPSLEDATAELSFKGSYEVTKPSGGVFDTFRCFALEDEDGIVEFAEDTWVDGFEFFAGNTKVVHHVLIYTVSGLETHMAGGLTEDDGNNSWECAGGVSRADGTYSVGAFNLLYGWVPGGLPLTLHDDMAMRIPASTGLVAQVHYNTLSASSSSADRTDLSSMKIRATDEPAREARMRLFGVAGQGDSDDVDDPPFNVPYGVKDHVESYTEQLPSFDSLDLRVWGFTPHMHLAGTSIKLNRTRTDGSEDCFIHVPRWDYNWQQFYVYDGDFEDLPQLRGEEQLTVSCTMDNTDDNPFLQEYLGGGVKEGVKLGEATEEEMCLIAIGLACEGLCPDSI